MVDVLRHNKVEVKLINKDAVLRHAQNGAWRSGVSRVKYANENIEPLMELVKEGYKLDCAYTLLRLNV